jgi:kynurenine formamidase
VSGHGIHSSEHETPTRIPAYDELPVIPDAPAGSAWGLFGAHDEIGALSLVDEDSVRRGGSMIRRGAVFSLNWDLALPDPPILGRGAYVREQVIQRAGTDDRYDNFHPQASSQWDALKHVHHPHLGYFNGHPQAEVEAPGSTTLGIHHWARRGIAAPFTLLDLARNDAQHGRAGFRAYGAEDLERTLQEQRTSIPERSVLLLRTGWTTWYGEASAAERRAAAEAGEEIHAPGLAPDEDVARWLWDHGVVAVASDAPALEAIPFDQQSVDGFLHYRLIALLGLAVGELFDLDPLAADCATDGVYHGLFTAAPLHLVGGSGSPANALAIK